MNKAERWHRISELFDRVVELPASEREAILATECVDDPQLRIEVRRLLQADERTNPIDHDIAGQASTLLLEGDAHEHEGQQFGPYRIVKLLAQGGMGRVYLAEREGEDFAQTVALKLVGGYGSFDAYTARRRFLDERRILARLQHPNIARLLDGGVGPEAQPWFAMEYVDGAPLTDWCDTQRLDVRQRLNLFAKVCEAVDHAHRFLIVHRDLKPGNVLVDHRGEPKVLDFGIAKLLDEGASERTGSTILMTPDYAAPEQIRGGQISTATDVYALGAVLFEVLTGRKPFCDPLASREAPQASRVATEGLHAGERANARASTPHALRKRLRGDIDRILRTALDPDPARRYSSAATLARDLRAVADSRAISLRSDRRYRFGVFLRRHKWETAAASLAVLGLLGTTGWALRQTSQATTQAIEAGRQAEIAKKEALASNKVSELLISAFEAADPGARNAAGEPTAKDILAAGAARVAKDLAGAPEVRARMERTLGRAYMNLDDEAKAIPLLESSIEGYLSATVKDEGTAAEVLSMLAMTEMNRSNSERAIALAKRAVNLRRRLQSPDDVKEAANILGMTLMVPGHYAEASRVLEENHALTVRLVGAKHQNTASSFNNRGHLAITMGNVKTAEAHFRSAMAIHQGLNFPLSLANSWNGLAKALVAQGRPLEGYRLMDDYVRVYGDHHGQDTVRFAKAIRARAAFRYQVGDLVGAQTEYESAIATMVGAGEGEEPDSAKMIQQLGETLQARGDLEGAETQYRRAEKILAAAYSPSSPEALRSAAYLAGLMAEHRGQPAQRAQVMAKTRTWTARYGIDSPGAPDLTDAMFLNAKHRLLAGRLDEVEAALPSVQALQGQATRLALRRYWLGRLRNVQGQQKEAVAALGEAVAAADAWGNKGSAWLALWRLDYAEALFASGRREQARVQLALATSVLRVQLVPRAPALARLEKLRRISLIAAK